MTRPPRLEIVRPARRPSSAWVTGHKVAAVLRRAEVPHGRVRDAGEGEPGWIIPRWGIDRVVAAAERMGGTAAVDAPDLFGGAA